MAIIFYILFFFTPLIMWPYTSEIFEFNKIIFLYISTSFILTLWIIKSVRAKKIVFKPTALDIPLTLFLFSQLISTVLSIDPRTSFLGYYSRFNGGLLSSICYGILYWAYVSNINSKENKRSIYFILSSMFFVCVYGILQHYGIDKDIWVQDVQNRVFSTLGQPNWLAACLVTLLPISYFMARKNKLFYFLSVIFFITLLFTKSRSGILGFAISSIAYWSITFYYDFKNTVKPFIFLSLVFLTLFFSIQSPFQKLPTNTEVQGPALETGGTNSGEIRKIVWRGAIKIWNAYPIFGSGPETFAFIYPKYKPLEHNLVSEWDFIYNKAHNEYLNLLATTGIFGLVTYLIFIVVGAKIMATSFLKNKIDFLPVTLFAGISGMLIANFFGFSVVTTQIYLFLFPAIAYATNSEDKHDKIYELKINQIIATTIVTSILLILTFTFAYRYFFADVNYNYAASYNQSMLPNEAITYLNKAIKLSPNEPVFHMELAKSYALLSKPEDAINESKIAINLSPSNIFFKRILYTVYVRLVKSNPEYLVDAKKILEDSLLQAPTDPKIFYNLGVTLWRLNELEQAEKILLESIYLKSNYKEARFAYALLLIDLKRPDEARVQLEYILQNIDPSDELTKDELSKIISQ